MKDIILTDREVEERNELARRILLSRIPETIGCVQIEVENSFVLADQIMAAILSGNWKSSNTISV